MFFHTCLDDFARADCRVDNCTKLIFSVHGFFSGG
jgi:hypothetical protein